MRVVVESFERWYNSQARYRKVDGPAPTVLGEGPMTIADVASELGIPKSTAHTIICTRNEIKHTLIDGTNYISRADFESWYAHQHKFRKPFGEPPGQAFPESMSVREMADLLGIQLRNTGYSLIQKGCFETFKIDGRVRIDTASFEKWYKTQTHYKKVNIIGGNANGINHKEEE